MVGVGGDSPNGRPTSAVETKIGLRQREGAAHRRSLSGTEQNLSSAAQGELI